MVFGNMGETSATGVAFTRDPATGEKVFYGEYLINAQGEDVVAGVRTPNPVAQLGKEMPEAYQQLLKVRELLEKHFRDMQDLEFTIEDNRLYILQTRNGKRTGLAAIKIAVDMVKEKLISKEEALLRIPADSLSHVLAPIFDKAKRSKCHQDRIRAARRTRGGERAPCPSRRGGGPARPSRRTGSARPHRNIAGRPARHDRRGRHSHCARRRFVARGAGRPPDGQGLRLRRQRTCASITSARR